VVGQTIAFRGLSSFAGAQQTAKTAPKFRMMEITGGKTAGVTGVDEN
jgi:hypothetical protein